MSKGAEIIPFRDAYVIRHKHESWMCGYSQAMRDEPMEPLPTSDKEEWEKGWRRGVMLRRTL